jgi:C-terminal processing protease CtpA/Prc
LTSKAGTYDPLAVAETIGDKLGAELETLDKNKARQYQVEGGVVVKDIKKGGPFSKTRMEKGFIITNVSGIDVTSVEELRRALISLRGESIYMEGIYADADGVYRYPLNIGDEE